MTLWMVRAGKRGEREELALEKGIAVIGWEELPDLSSIGSREDLLTLMDKVYSEKERKTLLNWCGQVWAFLRRIEQGDLVALPLKGRSAIAVGKVTGEYAYREDLPPDARHTRLVEWIDEWPRYVLASAGSSE